MDKGIFVISLDFELYWGLRDKKAIENYYDNLNGVWTIIPKLLDIFEGYGIHATWATVGFLFCDSYEHLLKCLPKTTPLYAKPIYCPVTYIKNNEHQITSHSKLHFAKPLINLIKERRNQEIGTHTLSHYYCLEQGVDISNFSEDLRLSISLAKDNGINTEALVFPRNQFNSEYLRFCGDIGILAYRGNQPSAYYAARKEDDEKLARRLVRLIDAYINVTGHHVYQKSELKSEFPVNIPASRLLRPYNPRLKILDTWRISRIKASMTMAAKTGGLFHLWWHPHNFGANQEDNINILLKIMQHYSYLQDKYGFLSMNMTEAARYIHDL